MSSANLHLQLIICRHVGLTVSQQVHQFPLNGRHFQWLSVTERCDLRWNENSRHLEMFFPLTPSPQSADNHIQQHSNVIGWGNQVFFAWLVAHARTHIPTRTRTHKHAHITTSPFLVHYPSKSNSIHQFDLELLLEYRVCVYPCVCMCVCACPDSINNAFRHPQ